LIPVVGDIITTAISLWLVREARALGAPWHVTARMLGQCRARWRRRHGAAGGRRIRRDVPRPMSATCGYARWMDKPAALVARDPQKKHASGWTRGLDSGFAEQTNSLVQDQAPE
jgi:hypothetical protein